MRLLKRTSDCIQILVVCHRAGDGLIKVGQIAEELGLTKRMALKLANILSQAGYLVTVRGPKGGIRLAEKAKTAKLGQIIRALESLTDRGFSSGLPPQFHRQLDDAFDAFLDVMDQYTLSDFASSDAPAPVERSTTKLKANVR